jgi:RND family efflux transporter MFP subunit
MSSLEIEVDVNEAYINRVQPGQQVAAVLDAYPDWEIPCHVIAIIPTADRQRATVQVRVGFDELDSRILPDMGVKVAFQDSGEGRSDPGVRVPAEALKRREGRDAVLVVSDDRVERRAVRVGGRDEGEVTVIAGLAEGERVVVAGPEELDEGDRVVEMEP